MLAARPVPSWCRPLPDRSLGKPGGQWAGAPLLGLNVGMEHELNLDSARFAEDLTARLSGTSARELARVSGWGRTTVTEIIKGRRLPTSIQLEDLLTAAGVDESERLTWGARLRQECSDSLTRSSNSATKVTPGPAARRKRPGANARRVLGVAVLASCSFAGAMWWTRPHPVRDVSGRVVCQTGAAVVGVWLAPEHGDGSWARIRSGSEGSVVFNGEVADDIYRVFVGCGGTPQQWATESRSGLVRDSDVRLACDDRSSMLTVAPYIGRCEQDTNP